jgi:hypothetical protein
LNKESSVPSNEEKKEVDTTFQKIMVEKISQIKGHNQKEIWDFVSKKKTPTYNPNFIIANYKDPEYVNILYKPKEDV